MNNQHWIEIFAGRTRKQLQEAYDAADGQYDHIIEQINEEMAAGHYAPAALLAKMEELEDCLQYLRGKLDDKLQE